MKMDKITMTAGPFSCVVIGEGNAALRCLEFLCDASCSITAVFTNGESVAQFCERLSIHTYKRGACIEECLQGQRFDYLFSINNPRILTPSVLALADRFTINYHDSPLPAYAGVNATSWALLHGEKQHGVTWHVVEPGIDTGDILRNQIIHIDKDDSALSLNLKCLDACLDSFQKLVHDLMNGKINPMQQDLTKRSYYGLYDVPPNLGILTFDSSSLETYDLARALEFGNHDNQLGSPKICTSEGHFLLVTKVEFRQEMRAGAGGRVEGRGEGGAGERRRGGGHVTDVIKTKLSVGEILNIEEDNIIVVATNTGKLVLSLAELDGHHLSAKRLFRCGLSPGLHLSSVQGMDMELAKQIRKKEPFWRAKMKNYEPTSFFIQKLNMMSNVLDITQGYSLEEVTIAMPQLDIPDTGCCLQNLLTASFVTFLGRVCCTDDVHIGLLVNKDSIPKQYRSLYSSVCPGRFTIGFVSSAYDAIQACVDELETHKEAKTFLTDMFYRYQELRGVRRMPHHNLVVGYEAETPLDVRSYSEVLSDSNLLVILGEKQTRVLYKNTPGNSYSNVVDVIRHYPTFIRSFMIQDAAATLLDVSLISGEEEEQLYSKQHKKCFKEEEDDNLFVSFRKLCDSQPEHTALISTHHHLTYHDLQAEIQHLSQLIAGALSGEKSSREVKECMSIHLPNSIDYVVCALSVVSLDCPFLPLPVDLPTERLGFMLRDSRVTVMFTSSSILSTNKFKELSPAPIVLFETKVCSENLVMLRFLIDENDNFELGGNGGLPSTFSFSSLSELDLQEEEKEVTLDPDCCYVMYTSGSTGKPKGVQVKRSGVLNMAKAQIKLWNLGPDDVIGQFASIGFDATISEMFTAFLSGATLAVLSDGERLGKELVNAVTSLGVTTITLPPSVLNIYKPSNFPTLKKVVTAGEACTIQTAVRWTNDSHVRFFNAYGPTEATVCATIYEFDSKIPQVNGTFDLPIGKQIPGSYVYLFDAFRKPVPPGVIGEIFVGGKGVSAGYIGHAVSKNDERFVSNPLNSNERLYRTGDHAIQTCDGILTYVGRLDDEVKIRGQRVDLNEIEQIILQHAKVEMAVVVKHRGKTANDSSIAAFVAPTIVVTHELREYLSKALPKYMIPTYIKKLDLKDFPVTLNGKVDRRKLERDESVYECSWNPGTSQLSYTEFAVAELWCKILDLDQGNAYSMHRRSTFTENGGNSLHLVLLQRAIEENFGVFLSFKDIGAASTIHDFSDIIKRKSDVLKIMSGSQEQEEMDLKQLILDDSVLDEGSFEFIPSHDESDTVLSDSMPRNVLLSGVTGFLGAYLLHELLEQTNTHVSCMVRESSVTGGFNRVVNNMQKYKLWKCDYQTRITIVLSDLSQPQMGIDPDKYRVLSTAVDTVFMNGAKMNFNTSYKDHRLANVTGTKQLIQFALTGRRKCIFLTSSLAVFLFPPGIDQLGNTVQTDAKSKANVNGQKYNDIISELSENACTNNKSDKLRVIASLEYGLNGRSEGHSLHSTVNGRQNTSDEHMRNNHIFHNDLYVGQNHTASTVLNNSAASLFNGNNKNDFCIETPTDTVALYKNDDTSEYAISEIMRLNTLEKNEVNRHTENILPESENDVAYSEEIKLKSSLFTVSRKTKKKGDETEIVQRIKYTETDSIRDPSLLCGGYAQSKWSSEQLVLQALDLVPGGAVFRPARVSGDSCTGVGPTSDLFASIIIGMEKMGVAPDMDFPFDLTPVDYCARAMVEVMVRTFQDPSREMPRVYHLFNTSTIPFRDLFEGTHVRKVPLEDWRKELTNIGLENPLLPLIPFLKSDFWDRAHNWPMFCVSNTKKYTSKACHERMLPSSHLLDIYKRYFKRVSQEPHSNEYKDKVT